MSRFSPFNWTHFCISFRFSLGSGQSVWIKSCLVTIRCMKSIPLTECIQNCLDELLTAACCRFSLCVNISVSIAQPWWIMDWWSRRALTESQVVIQNWVTAAPIVSRAAVVQLTVHLNLSSCVAFVNRCSMSVSRARQANRSVWSLQLRDLE